MFMCSKLNTTLFTDHNFCNVLLLLFSSAAVNVGCTQVSQVHHLPLFLPHTDLLVIGFSAWLGLPSILEEKCFVKKMPWYSLWHEDSLHCHLLLCHHLKLWCQLHCHPLPSLFPGYLVLKWHYVVLKSVWFVFHCSAASSHKWDPSW